MVTGRGYLAPGISRHFFQLRLREVSCARSLLGLRRRERGAGGLGPQGPAHGSVPQPRGCGWLPRPQLPCPQRPCLGAQVPGAQVLGAQVLGAQVLGAQVPGAQVPRARVPGARVSGAQVSRAGPARPPSCCLILETVAHENFAWLSRATGSRPARRRRGCDLSDDAGDMCGSHRSRGR